MDYDAFKYSATSETPDRTTAFENIGTLQAARICGVIG